MVASPVSEVNINLNVQEVGILISALQLLDLRDEIQIAKECGSASSLYNRLKDLYDVMDQSEIGVRNDITPSY